METALNLARKKNDFISPSHENYKMFQATAYDTKCMFVCDKVNPDESNK